MRKSDSVKYVGDRKEGGLRKSDDIETLKYLVGNKDVSKERIVTIFRHIIAGSNISVHTAKGIILATRPCLKSSLDKLSP